MHTNMYHVLKILTSVILARIVRLDENQTRIQGRLPTCVQNSCPPSFIRVTDRTVEGIPVQILRMMCGLRESIHEVDHDDQSNLQRPQRKAGFEIVVAGGFHNRK